MYGPEQGQEARLIAEEQGIFRRSRLTACQQALQVCGMVQVLAHVKHSQTHGKLKRLFRTLGGEMNHFGEVPEFIEYYNEERLYFSADMDSGEIPWMESRNKMVSKAIRKTRKQLQMDGAGSP